MGAGTTLNRETTPSSRSFLAEAGLLELFAPTRTPIPAVALSSRNEHASLWRADAIHRAKNMAQMAISLSNVADHPSRRWLPPEVIAQIRCLSRAYEALGIESDPLIRVPCRALLTEIATRLTDIFGRSKQIAISISGDAVLLTPDARRALLLMCSELVINALKYGYPAGTGGTISVTLAARCNAVELVVEDDGIGVGDSCFDGMGSGLLERLRNLLVATVTRSTGPDGRGLQISTLVPIDEPEGGNA